MGGSRAIFSLTLSLFLSIDSFGGSWLLDPCKYELVRILPPDTHIVSVKHLSEELRLGLLLWFEQILSPLSQQPWAPLGVKSTISLRNFSWEISTTSSDKQFATIVSKYHTHPGSDWKVPHEKAIWHLFDPSARKCTWKGQNHKEVVPPGQKLKSSSETGQYKFATRYRRLREGGNYAGTKRTPQSRPAGLKSGPRGRIWLLRMLDWGWKVRGFKGGYVGETVPDLPLPSWDSQTYQGYSGLPKPIDHPLIKVFCF